MVDDPALSQMQVSMYSASGDATARLSLSGMFEVNADKTTRVLFLEALVRGDDEEPAFEMDGDRKVVQYLVRRGFGIRIVMQVLKWSWDKSLSISAVAAKSQVEGQQVQYYVETLGLPDALERQVLDAVGITGPINENSFVKLRKLVTETLPAYLRQNPAAKPDASKGQRAPLELAEYRVPAETEIDELDMSRYVNMAMTHIARGDTLRQAKQGLAAGSALTRDAASDLAGDIIEQTYQRNAGIGSEHADLTPPADAVSAARKWLQFQV